MAVRRYRYLERRSLEERRLLHGDDDREISRLAAALDPLNDTCVTPNKRIQRIREQRS
jgi:hypothetical protein